MHETFAALHPCVAGWCAERLGAPTPPQTGAIGRILAGENVLVCSPTGTGKTLAAFLPLVSDLARRRDRDELFPRPYVLYVSPLRALGYDVEHNLRRPLREMGLLERPNSPRAERRRGRLREQFVRTGVRTSDTPLDERRLMLARPPHIVVTTPESLALMLAMESYRKILRDVEAVVVDEIHALAGNKRGAYLSLCLEALAEHAKRPPRRIGLSATVAPLERVARFLAGDGRPCAIVDERGLRSIRVDIATPFAGAIATMAQIAQSACAQVAPVRSALVFTNVRSQAERLAHEMELHAAESETVATAAPDVAPRASDRRIGIHHSSLERSVRHRVEAQLRAGEVHTVVCSSSLELGVDIGFVDRVCVIGGARGIASTLQRVGRAGHRPDAIADGVVIAQDRDDVIEAAATRRLIADGVLEEIVVPSAPLDVLAQWLAMLAVPDRRVEIARALSLARRAYGYRDLSEIDLRRCIAYLSGAGAGADEAHVRRIGADDDAIYGLGRDVSAAFFENVGTIPDENGIVVVAGGKALGKVEDGFVAALREGDVFLLGGKTLRVKEIGARGVIVEPHAGRPNVPAWSSHIKGISTVLADEIARLRSGVYDRLRGGGPSRALRWLGERYNLRGEAAAHVVRYVAQQAAISAVPPPGSALVEVYRMDARQTAIFHTCAGRRANEALARIVAARLVAHGHPNSQITTDDNGFLVMLPTRATLGDGVWATLLHARDVERDLLAGLRGSHLLRRHFRYVANTGLLVLRRAGGRSVRRGAQSWNAERIFDRLAVADPDFPLVRETIRFVTRDLLDFDGARAYLEALAGPPRVLHPPAASPFSFGIVTSSFGDAVVLDDRTAMVEALHERVLAIVAGDALARNEAALPLFGAAGS